MDDAVTDDSASWTLDELVRRVELALTDSAQGGRYAGAPNGRVRELPDQRVIRWYTSIGLVDRPTGGRGRGARYGLRHLRQLVAVKQLQAQGLPLVEIQGRLVGIADDDLARLAQSVPLLPPLVQPPPTPLPPVRPLAGLELASGVLLVLPTTPGPDDLIELAEAVRPLLVVLRRRGLIPAVASPAEPTEGAPR